MKTDPNKLTHNAGVGKLSYKSRMKPNTTLGRPHLQKVKMFTISSGKNEEFQALFRNRNPL